MKAEQLMSANVYTCRTIDTLDRAAQLMREHEIGSLPVVDEGGHVVGIITDRDICMATYVENAPPRALDVGATMSPHPTTCGRGDDVATVTAQMRRRRVHRVPVVDDAGHPVGIISLDDLAKATRVDDGLSPDEVASTLAAVCTRRPLA